MDLAGAQRLTCFLQTISRLGSNTDNSRHNHAPINRSSDGPARAGCTDRLVRLGPALGPAPQQRHTHADLSRSNLDFGT
jgi:hypothetical protein